MKSNELVDFFEKFYLDIVGVFVPGAFFIFLLSILCPPAYYPLIEKILSAKDTLFIVLMLVLLSFVTGQMLSALSTHLMFPLSLSFFSLLRRYFPVVEISKIAVSRNELIKILRDKPEVKRFKKKYYESEKEAFADKDEISVDEFQYLRNTALSVAPASNQLVYKFMYMSKMYVSFATAIALFIPVVISKMCLATLVRLFVGLIGGSLLIVLVLLYESFEYYRRAMYTPFSSALEELRKENYR